MKSAENIVASLKTELFKNVSGRVVEIGAGEAVNLEFLDPKISYTALEPNKGIHDTCNKNLEIFGFKDYKIIPATAEATGIPSESVDVAISTFTLCSVRSPHLALAEIQRILKPGGTFLFFEHVRAPRGTVLRFLQNFLNPFLKTPFDSCNINRDTEYTIRRAGFAYGSWKKLTLQHWSLASPHIIGKVVKSV